MIYGLLLTACVCFQNHWEKDLHQYYFFQLLTVTGAMLLIASRGAGRYSMDHNKKFG